MMNINQVSRLRESRLAAVGTSVGAALLLLTLALPAAAQSAGGTIAGLNVDWAPDGKSLAFAANWDGDNEIYIMDLDGRNITQLTHNEGSDLIPAFTSDGRAVLFSSNVDGRFEVHRLAVEGGPSQVVVTDPGASLLWPDQGPDGRILFVANIIDGNGAAEIRVLDPENGEVAILVADGSKSDTPTWLPSGEGFLFSSNRSGKLHIYRADADGTNQRVVTSLPEGAERYGSARPSLTPDGKTLIYWGDEGGNFMHDHHHNSLDMETGEVVTLPKRVLSMAYPDVSPDGRRIVYAAGLGGSRPFSIYVMNLDGSDHKTVWAPAR